MMEMHRPPKTFTRASEITITAIAGESLVLEAPGFFAEIKMHWSGIRLLLTTERAPDKPGSDPLYCVKIGNDSIVRLASEEQANTLVDSIGKVLLASNIKSRKPDVNPNSLPYKLISFAETCGTAVIVAFLGAGMANVGWQTFAPAADRAATYFSTATNVQVMDPQILKSSVFATDYAREIQGLDSQRITLEEALRSNAQVDALDIVAIYEATQKHQAGQSGWISQEELRYFRERLQEQQLLAYEQQKMLPDVDSDRQEAALADFQARQAAMDKSISELKN